MQMNIHTAIALLFASASALASLSAAAQDTRYDPRANPDYRYQPPAYAPPPMQPAPMASPAVFQDNARVLRVSPRIEQVSSPQEECRMEIERVAPAQNAGQGRSLGGALVGESVGSSMNNSQAQYGPVDREVRRCSVVNRVIERNAGYDVSYSYNGRTYNAVMPNDPGTSLRVNVAVTPVSGY